MHAKINKFTHRSTPSVGLPGFDPRCDSLLDVSAVRADLHRAQLLVADDHQRLDGRLQLRPIVRLLPGQRRRHV